MSQLRKAALFLLLLALVATASAAGSHRVQIYVHPGSGTVCLDNDCQVNVGTLSGYSSTQFADVVGGRDHTIRVYNTPGYEDYDVDIYMDYAGDSVTRTIYLDPVPEPEPATPAPADGDLQVYVSPGLGMVCLDEKECEVAVGPPMDTWSVRFSAVESSVPHTISVTADGYVTSERQVSVQPGGILTVNVDLQPVSSPDTSGGTQPTRAGLPALVAVAGAGIGGALVILKRKG